MPAIYPGAEIPRVIGGNRGPYPKAHKQLASFMARFSQKPIRVLFESRSGHQTTILGVVLCHLSLFYPGGGTLTRELPAPIVPEKSTSCNVHSRHYHEPSPSKAGPWTCNPLGNLPSRSKDAPEFRYDIQLSGGSNDYYWGNQGLLG